MAAIRVVCSDDREAKTAFAVVAEITRFRETQFRIRRYTSPPAANQLRAGKQFWAVVQRRVTAFAAKVTTASWSNAEAGNTFARARTGRPRRLRTRASIHRDTGAIAATLKLIAFFV